jgi:hypothetical protein
MGNVPSAMVSQVCSFVSPLSALLCGILGAQAELDNKR